MRPRKTTLPDRPASARQSSSWSRFSPCERPDDPVAISCCAALALPAKLWCLAPSWFGISSCWPDKQKCLALFLLFLCSAPPGTQRPGRRGRTGVGGKANNLGDVTIKAEYFPEFVSSYRGLHLLVRCSEGPLNFAERGFKTKPSLTPAQPWIWRVCVRGSTGRGQPLLPSRDLFLPCLQYACLLGIEEKFRDLHPTCRSERLPRLPGSRDSRRSPPWGHGPVGQLG